MIRIGGAAIAAGAVLLMVVGAGRDSLTERVRRYLEPTDPHSEDGPTRRSWDLSFTAWIAGGMIIGLLLAQGDLFISGAGRSAPGLAALGAAGGWFLWSAKRSTAAERRALRLRHELPVVAEVLALHTLAGESVGSAIASAASSTTGVAAEELASVVAAHGAGASIEEALLAARSRSAHADAGRLYETLIHAHTSGGQLARSLADLAADLRSRLEDDLRSEAGKRAITSYGPVLALMVPTALLFLLYPTLLGLRTLSGSP